MAANTSRQRDTRKSQTGGNARKAPETSLEERRARIAETAYFLAQRRAAEGAAAPDIDNWLEAERVIDDEIEAASHVHHQHGEPARY